MVFLVYIGFEICRSREGAWIEIIAQTVYQEFTEVAPVRERGLKCCYWTIWNEWFRVAPVRERGLKCP